MTDAKTPSAAVTIEVVRGVEGPSLYVNDRRVAGPKPWGGGQVIHKFKVDVDELRRHIPTCPACAGTGEEVASTRSRPRGRGWKNTRLAGAGGTDPTEWWRPCPKGCNGPGPLARVKTEVAP